MRYVILCLLLLGLACSKSEPTTATTAAPPAEGSAAPTEPGDGQGQPEGSSADALVEPSIEARPSITLVSPGSEPRRILRWKFEKDSKETMKVWSQVAMIAQMGVDGEQTTVTPPVVRTLALEVQGAQPDGSTTVHFEVTNIVVLEDDKAKPSTREKLVKAASSIQGTKGTYQVDAQGVVTGFEMVKPAEGESRDQRMAESLGEFLARSTVPVPSEAVGKGGTWTVQRRLIEGGITIDQTSTYELKKLDGSEIAVRVKVEKSARVQEIGTPGTYSHYVLKSFVGKGQGERRADLSKLVPQESASKTDTELKTFMQQQGGLALQQDLRVEAQELISAP